MSQLINQGRGFVKNTHTAIGKQLRNSEIRNALFSALVFLIVANPSIFKFVGKIIKVKDPNTLLLVHALVFATIMYFGSLYIFEPVRKMLFKVNEGFGVDLEHTHSMNGGEFTGGAIEGAGEAAAPRPAGPRAAAAPMPAGSRAPAPMPAGSRAPAPMPAGAPAVPMPAGAPAAPMPATPMPMPAVPMPAAPGP